MKKITLAYKFIFRAVAGCLFTLLAVSVSAQTRGKVEVIKDPRIDTLVARRAELNKAIGIGEVNGFRVQIFTGSNRKEAYNMQAKFQQDFPDIRSYVIYSDPNFKVRVGDFRTRLDAEKLQDQLKRSFDGTFIITEKINPPQPEGKDE